MRSAGRPLARGIVIPTERACRRRLPRADGAQFRFVQHCAKRDSNAELAAVAAITYSDLLLGMPGWLGDGLVHHLADEKGRSHG